MGTRTIFRLTVGICILGAVSAQYPYNSLYRGPEKDPRHYRPQIPFPSHRPAYPPSSGSGSSLSATTSAPESSNDPARFSKIMKQINKVNDDGSYTFGFENDDGSFRVETRTKDGLVKGKYGFIDANGQLKVTEYTAGEKSEEPEEEINESEEDGGDFRKPRPSLQRSQPLSARPPVPSSQGHFIPSRPYNVGPQPLGSRHVVQASPSPYRIGSRSSNVDQAPAAQTSSQVARAPPTSDDDFSEDDESDFQKRQSPNQQDSNNGQYFRQSISPSGQGAAGPARGRFPGAGGGRPLYAQGGPGAYAQQYPQGVAPQGAYPGAGGPQGFPVGGPQGFGPQGPQGFGGPGPQYSGFAGGFPGAGGRPGPQSFPRLQQAPQDFSSIPGNARPSAPRQEQPQVQNFGGFGQHFGSQGQSSKGDDGQIPADEQYVPSVELDGYSEDLDQDGYPDEPPKDGKLPLKSPGSGASQSPRPFPGPQSRPQGQPQIFLQIGQNQGSPVQGGVVNGPGRFAGGPGPQYVPQQGFGGFPSASPQNFQSFPQGFQGFGPQGPQFSQVPQGAQGQPARFGDDGQGASIQGPQGGGFPFEFSPFGGAFPGAPSGFPSPQGFPGGARGGQQQVQNLGGFPSSGSGFGPGRFSSPSGAAGLYGGSSPSASGSSGASKKN